MCARQFQSTCKSICLCLASHAPAASWKCRPRPHDSGLLSFQAAWALCILKSLKSCRFWLRIMRYGKSRPVHSSWILSAEFHCSPRPQQRQVIEYLPSSESCASTTCALFLAPFARSQASNIPSMSPSNSYSISPCPARPLLSLLCPFPFAASALLPASPPILAVIRGAASQRSSANVVWHVLLQPGRHIVSAAGGLWCR